MSIMSTYKTIWNGKEVVVYDSGKFSVSRMDTYLYYQPDGTWGDKKTAKGYDYDEVYAIRHQCEKELGVSCSVGVHA